LNFFGTLTDYSSRVPRRLLVRFVVELFILHGVEAENSWGKVVVMLLLDCRGVLLLGNEVLDVSACLVKRARKDDFLHHVGLVDE
jgi:hypothetical protein